MILKKDCFRLQVHERIVENLSKAESWFKEKIAGKTVPFYSSFDIRDSSFKAVCVDANLFPAGFNNICEADQKRAASLMENYLKSRYPFARKILLLAEEHTKNLYYWDNIFIIKSLIEAGGYEVKVCVPGKKISSAREILTAAGRKMRVSLLNEEKGDLIISNNDFSTDCALPPGAPVTPCFEMGWQFRKKSGFFHEYNKIAAEFAEIIGMDPWRFSVQTELFSPFDIESKESLSRLKSKADLFLSRLRSEKPPGAEEEPYLFLKNNSGTYGLGVIAIDRAAELDGMGYRIRKKMKASKGGRGVKELIIQEGIPTALSSVEGQSAEPVIYMAGEKLAGGFLRSHQKKDHKANLNSPGAVYRRLCVSDLEIEVKGQVMENVYGWVGKLGLLALVSEIERGGLDFKGYA